MDEPIVNPDNPVTEAGALGPTPPAIDGQGAQPPSMEEALGADVAPLKEFLEKKGLPLTLETITQKLPAMLENTEQWARRVEAENAQYKRLADSSQGVFVPGPTPPTPGYPNQQGAGYNNPDVNFINNFASNPKAALQQALMELIAPIAEQNKTIQKQAADFEAYQMENHPLAKEIMPGYERYLRKGFDYRSAWDRARLEYYDNRFVGNLSRLAKNAERGKAAHVEGSGGASDIPSGGPDFSKMTLEEQRAWILANQPK